MGLGHIVSKFVLPGKDKIEIATNWLSAARNLWAEWKYKSLYEKEKQAEWKQKSCYALLGPTVGPPTLGVSLLFKRKQ